MYELTFTFRLADLVRCEVRSKQRSDHPLVIQCLVTERLVTERSHYKFSRITKRSMYDTYVRNDNVNALYASRRGAPRPIIVAFNRYTTRCAILANARRFLKDRPYNYEEKECRIFIDEMLPKEIRNERKKLANTRQKLKEQHGKAYFKYPARLCYRDKETKKEVEYKK